MKKHWHLTSLMVMILTMVLSACSGFMTNPAEDSPDQIDDELPPVAAVVAREMLAAELGVDVEEVTLVSHEQATWQDSCLGLGGIAESCLRTEVEGWLVELSANSETFKAHTDWLGDQVRFEP